MNKSFVMSALCGLAVVLAACSDSTSPPGGNGQCSTTPVSLGALQGATFAAEDLPSCLTIQGDGATYLVVPQFATSTASMTPVTFQVSADYSSGSSSAELISASVLRNTPAASLGRPQTVQNTFDQMLRRKERGLSASAAAAAAARGSIVRAAVAPPALGSTRQFQVCSNLSCQQFKTDTAIVKYVGNNIIIYQGQHAPAPPNGFTDAQIQAFGNTFDQDLYTIDVATFGAPSDIDGNGRVIVLMSPIINQITPAATCQSQGFVAGFFYGLDLIPSQPHSNGAEIFYAAVPDPTGQFSCAHSLAQMGRITPSTFIHEFQHMISFNQHVLVRNGSDEDPWLNEGLSHVAEELGSRYYENKFPPPSGRTDPTQMFPDSSQGFIIGDLLNSYDYLLNTTAIVNDSASVSNWGNGDGTLVQRGAAWLFLRWLGDKDDSTVYGRLDQTSLTGEANVQNADGNPFRTLFGQFALALYTDSLVGVPRSDIPPQYRFQSRNLREMYQNLFNRNGPSSDIPRAFPIVLTPLSIGTAVQGTMFPGTMDFYRLTAPTNASGDTRTILLRFRPQTGTSFQQGLAAQVSVFRCPSAAACP